jgi:hypothetical protein
MTRTNAFLMFGAGAALAAGALFLMSQAAVPSSTGSSVPRKGVINIFEYLPNTAPITVPPGQDYVVASVPNNRWLSVTACSASALTVPPPGGIYGQVPTLIWGERYNGTFIPKGPLGVWGAGASYLPPYQLGEGGQWVFRPGSEVVLRESGGPSGWPVPSIAVANEIRILSLTGYYTRE